MPQEAHLAGQRERNNGFEAGPELEAPPVYVKEGGPPRYVAEHEDTLRDG